MKRYLFYVITFTIWAACFPAAAFSWQAPHKATISGRVIDTVTGQPIYQAAVSLISDTGKMIIAGVASDKEGKFSFRNIAEGKYHINVRFIGYHTGLLRNIVISNTDTLVKTGTLKLHAQAKHLSQVEVTAPKNIFEANEDGFIYHAAEDVTNQSGNAADVFRKIPMLVVDPNGNVSLMGHSSVKVLIDGKPSSIVAMDIAEALKIIPANEIRAVEIITNPSAKYEAEGSGGIINIITKKKRLEGLYGNMNISAGNLNNSFSGSVNQCKSRSGLNASLNAAHARSLLYTQSERIKASGDVRRLLQQTDRESRTGSLGGQLCAEYDLDSSQSIATTLRYKGSRLNYDNKLLSRELDDAFQLMHHNGRYTTGERNTKGMDWIIDYTKKFKRPQQELSASVKFISGTRNTAYDLLQRSGNGGTIYNELNTNDGDIRELTLQLDYTHPFAKGRTLEAGIKSILRDINSRYTFHVLDDSTDKYIFDPGRSGAFYYRQYVHAAYATFSIAIKKVYLLKAGLRMEGTVLSGDSWRDASAFSNNYLSLVPGLTLARRLKKPGSVVKLGYSRRIQRPGLTYLNPYVNQVDAKNISFGNPDLTPELTDAYELRYNTSFSKVYNGFTGYFRNTRNIIERITTVDNNGVSITTYQNISRSYTTGANIYAVYHITPTWDISGSLNIYNYHIRQSDELNNQGCQHTITARSNIRLTNGLMASITGVYHSPNTDLQGSTSAWVLISIGVSKDILKKKAKVGITSNNPYARDVKIDRSLKGAGFQQYVNSGQQFRSVNFTFQYQFGKTKTSKAKARGIRNDDLKEKKEGDTVDD